ncbi:MAG: PIN domain-containing protein [Cytophagaceae bacterium]|nr:PIN domain-containing protein [Gemmatimonadaceae bacterium]
MVLAQLLSEDRVPPVSLWDALLVSSRLLEYEVWTRLNGRGLARSHGELARDILARIAMVELLPAVLARALEPFPRPVRTLDALHLASADYLANARQSVALATYDDRMSAAAAAMSIPLYAL